MEIISSALGALFGLAIAITLFAIPVTMAKKRGRSVGGWLVLSFFITPLWAAIALAVLGDSKKKICDEIINNTVQTTQTPSTAMNKNFRFFWGMITGSIITILVVMFVMSSVESSSPSADDVFTDDTTSANDGLTLFDQPVGVIETASFEVQEVLANGNAIAESQHKDVDEYYTDPVVYLLADENSYYYDKQIVRVAKGKQACQVGIYKYEEYRNTKTLPVVRIMNK